MKTFAQLIAEKTSQVVYQGTSVASDSDTISSLYDWFQFRELNYEDDKFLAMYKRNLDMFYPKYKLLLEDELSELPSLDNFKSEITGQLRNYGTITDELARLIVRDNERTDNLTSTTDMTRKDTGTIGNVETDTLVGTSRNDNQLNQNTTESTSSNSTTESDTNSTSESENEAHDVAKGLVRQLPQSTEYGAGGFPNTLDWTTGTTQAEDHTDTNSKLNSSVDTSISTDVDSSSSSQSNVTNTGYTTGSSNQTNNYNKTQTNNTQSTDEGTVKNTGTQNMNESVDEDTTNVRRLDDKHDSFRTEHGFKGMTEAEIRAEIWDYITNSIALQWFIGKMERCFIGIFE